MASVKFDIIIPHYGLDATLTRLCRNCLLSIIRYSQDFRIIFIDNGSYDTEEVYEILGRRPHLLVRNHCNIGFVQAVNQGFLLSTAEYIVVMNNDTQAVSGWLSALQSGFRLQSDVGAVGPRTTADSWQGRTPWRGAPRILPKDGMLAFFCAMFRRDVIKHVGNLDESFGVGLGDDSDYCRRLHLAGYRLALVPDLVIPHHHRSTFNAVYGVRRVSEMQLEALDRYNRKWTV